MDIYQEYRKYADKFAYDRETVKKILKIFDGGGASQIITDEIIPINSKIQNFLILSDQMQMGLNHTFSKLNDIIAKNEVNSGGIFYFCQYGGSKTQFLHLLKNEVISKIPNCITVLFEDLEDIKAINIFNEIFPQLFNVINRDPKISENKTKFLEFVKEIQEHIGNIQVSITQTTNLKKAEDIINDLLKIPNPQYKKKLNELRDLLYSTILVDDVTILNKIVKLMQFCSSIGISFLFLIDEVDLWFDFGETEFTMSEKFNKKEDFIKKILEISDNDVRSFFCLACTDRVNYLFKQNQTKLEQSSGFGSRLNRLFHNSEPIIEPGNYGYKIGNASILLAALYFTANGNNPNFDFLRKFNEHLSNNYANYSRRISNSKILQILNFYTYLEGPLKTGLKEWDIPQKNTFYGTLIQKHLPSILSYLNINFIRKDVFIDVSKQITSDKIDGYFENTKIGKEYKIYTEIKLTNSFSKEKSHQVLQWLQLHPNDPIIFIIFSPTSLDKIKTEVNSYAANKGFDLRLLERIRYIHIHEIYAFAPIIGIQQILSDSEKLHQFLSCFASWFDFFSNFTKNFNDIINELGFGGLVIDEGDKIGDDADKFKLTTDQQMCINLLTHIYENNLFSQSGKMKKDKLSRIVTEGSLAITDLDILYETMDKAQIVDNITTSFINFSKTVVNSSSSKEMHRAIIKKFKENS